MLTFLGLLVGLLILVVLLRLVRGAEKGGLTSKISQDGVLDFPRSARVRNRIAGGTPPSDPATRLKQLQEMKDSGLITDDEYEAKRAQSIDAL